MRREEKKPKGNAPCKHGLTPAFCALCNPQPETETPETEQETKPRKRETETPETKRLKDILDNPGNPKPETNTTLVAYKIILDGIEKTRKRIDKVVRGNLIETVSNVVNLQSRVDWESLDLVHETLIKVFENRVSPWAKETPENMVRYLRGAIRKRLITVKQETPENPVSFWDSQETLTMPDTENQNATFKKDLFELVLNAKRKNGKDLLNAKEKTLFDLYYRQGLNYQKIANETHGNYDSIRKEVSRVNAKMSTLKLKDYFNDRFVSPNGVYFPRHTHDVSDVQGTNLAPLRRYRITKDIDDYERWKVEHIKGLKYQRRHNAGNLRQITPETHKTTPWQDPFKGFDPLPIWETWVSTPVYNIWVSTGRNGGYSLTPKPLLIREKPKKPLAFQPEKTLETVKFRNRVYVRSVRNDTRKDRVRRLITKAYNRGNMVYVQTLKTYLENMV